MSDIPILESALAAVSAGIVGTTGMTLVMRMIDRGTRINAGMVVAIGSVFTRSREGAARVGLAVHFTAGVLFAVLYTTLFAFYDIAGLLHFVGIGLGFGFIHGFVMSFILVIAVAEYHPLEEFREAGFAVAVVHVVGHIVYGTLVGLIIGLWGPLR